jgi:exosortase/archaeosortase family protein
MVHQQIKKIQEALPVNVRKFFTRAIILIAVWNLLYHLLLKPALVPDTQLTDLIVWGTVKVLSVFHSDVYNTGNNIFLYGVRSVNIDHQCNGLELIVLYVGFLLCLPSGYKKMGLFAVTGILVICFLNVLRCSALAWMFLNMRTVVDFAHHYAFKLVIYAVVFYGWILYTKKTANGKL